MNGVPRLVRRLAPLVLMLSSGLAGLGYQIVWTEQCALWLGHESAAVLSVVTAFFGGLALGGLLLGARVERSRSPLSWYAGCEVLIGLWSALLLWLLPSVSGWLVRAAGVQPSAAVQWALAFATTFVLFLPATAAMGATLPAMERLSGELERQGRSIAALYASNTLGAVLGVLASAFWLIPALGLARSAALCVALNLLCAALAFTLFPKTLEPVSAPPGAPKEQRARVLRQLALTGFLGIAYEVLIVRVLSQLTEDTVYTFALILAVYLLGSAAGAALYQRWLGARQDDRLVDHLLVALALACLGGTSSLWAGERVRNSLQASLGDGFAGALMAEALLALIAFGPATVLMGALFSQLCRSASAVGISFGRALGVNTAAAALAPAVCGVLVIPALGAKAALLLITLGYLLSSARATWFDKWTLAVAGLVGVVAVIAPPLRFIELADGDELISYEEGVMAAVSVVQDAGGVARLRINNRQQEGSSRTRRVDARQAWLPLLLHVHPQNALFLGLGTGVTATSAAEDASLQVDAVELLPEVIRAARQFSDDSTFERLHVFNADARRYVRSATRFYDVIVSDNFHPARSGSGALYTVEHFAAVRARLSDTGVFCQWLPLHQLDLDSLRSIVRSFLTVYPGAIAVIASNSLETPVIGLVGRHDPNPFDAVALAARLAQLSLPARHELGLEDELAVLGSAIASPSALRHFSGNWPTNTDDRPIVAYRAPRITYAPDSRPRDRLLALLQAVAITPEELLAASADASFARRLAAYWQARDRFIASGRDITPSARVNELLARVREPLLSVLRISPDFRPAYDPLLGMAQALARSNVTAARQLLDELAAIQPARSEATQLLALLGAGAPTRDLAQSEK